MHSSGILRFDYLIGQIKTFLIAGTSQVDNQQPRLNRVRFNDYRKHKEVSRVNID